MKSSFWRSNDNIGGGVWYTATMADGPDKWTILANADKGKDPSSSEVMFGTFNGRPASLWEMMQDTARNAAYFPAVPLARISGRTTAEAKVKGLMVNSARQRVVLHYDRDVSSRRICGRASMDFKC